MALSPQQFPGWAKQQGAHPQQGQLFPLPKPTDEHRWPRGYTPERMQEVRDNVKVTSEDLAGHGGGHFSGPAGPARVHQAIARSTAPMSEAAPFAFTTSSGDRAGQADVRIASSSYKPLGQFWQRGDEAFVTMSPRSHDPEQAAHNLMHEMGHNASYMAGNESSKLQTPAMFGREEAFADDYAVTHHRRDPRSGPEKYTGTYSGYESRDTWKQVVRGRFPGERNQSQRAFAAYKGARKTPFMKATQDAMYEGQPEVKAFRSGKREPLYKGIVNPLADGWSGR